MPDIQIEVIYCPHESFKDEAPLGSWPRVSGVAVTLTKKAGHAGDGPHAFAETDEKGLSGPLPAGEGTYTVKMKVPRLWALATKEFAVSKAAKQISRIILIPDEDRQLVLWKLTYDDPVAGSGALAEAAIKVAGHEFFSQSDGCVAAVAALGTATAKFEDYANADRTFLPQRKELNFPVSKAKNPAPRTMVYASDIRLSVEPVVRPPSGPERPLEGAVVTLDLNGLTLPAKTLGKKQHKVTFDRLGKGTYGIPVTPPAEGMTLVTSLDAIDLQPGDAPEVRALFRQERKIGGYVETEDGKRVTQPVELRISGDDGYIECAALQGKFEKFVAMDDPLAISVVPGQKLELAGIPLKRPAQDQPVLFPQETIVKLEYEHAIKGQALDADDMPVPGVMVAIFDAKQGQLTTVQADDQGQFIYGVAKPGDYFVAQQPQDA